MTTQTRALAAPMPLFTAARSVGVLALAAQARALSRQRAELAAMSADRLADLGLTPEAAALEAARPFWDAPRHWRG